MPRAPARRRALGLLAVGLVAAAGAIDAHAGVLRYCDPPTELSAAQQDRLLRFGAVIKSELERSGQRLALISRAGTDLSRFGVRYSHAGISLLASPNAPWSVRQLYYDCDERRPRLFDQGIAGFLIGASNPSIGYVSVVLLPESAAAEVERVAQDNRQVLRLLGTTYSANAYPFSSRYQNCNQWVAELLAVAWGALADADDLRPEAQRWLRDRGYTPTDFEVGNPLLMWLGGVLPWLHRDDHPADDLEQLRFRVSTPASIEAFVQATVPGARRVEFCHDERHVVVRRGGAPIADGCVPGDGDTVIALD